MLAEERRIRILQMLEEKNAVQLGELATLFRVIYSHWKNRDACSARMAVQFPCRAWRRITS